MLRENANGALLAIESVVDQFGNTPKAFANPSPGLARSDYPGIPNQKAASNPEESVGKIKIRKKQGMKNHSSSSKNSLQGKYAQEIF